MGWDKEGIGDREKEFRVGNLGMMKDMKVMEGGVMGGSGEN